MCNENKTSKQKLHRAGQSINNNIIRTLFILDFQIKFLNYQSPPHDALIGIRHFGQEYQ